MGHLSAVSGLWVVNQTSIQEGMEGTEMSLGDWTQYEWDVEEVSAADTEDREEGEVFEHYHQTSAKDCITFMQNNKPMDGAKWAMVLVLDDQDGRSWAYVEDDMTLPERFANADGCYVRKVPKRFHDELKKATGAV